MVQMNYASAVRDALKTALALDEKVIVYGLGTTDPKGVFGTTTDLHKEFGEERVFDVPVSENALTGMAIGAAFEGVKTVLTHQRLDFALLSLDQIVNNAAKWHYMFGGVASVPITIRMIIGKGWGQGPTHSQSLESWFAHVPGLKVVCPASAYDVKGMLLESIFDPNPVIVLEHRWLAGSVSEVPSGDYRVPLDKAKVVQEGSDLTIISSSYLVGETHRAIQYLEKEKKISIEHIDLRSVKPIDYVTILASVKKTKRLLMVDPGHRTCCISTEIYTKVMSELFHDLDHSPEILALPDVPSPTSYALTKYFYNDFVDIINKVMVMMDLGKPVNKAELIKGHHDVPGEWFKGPF